MIKIKKKKWRYADVGELVILFGHPLPIIRFVQQEFDKRQYWLEITDGLSIYYTSINLTRWDKFDLETKAGIVKEAIKYLKQND